MMYSVVIANGNLIVNKVFLLCSLQVGTIPEQPSQTVIPSSLGAEVRSRIPVAGALVLISLFLWQRPDL